jgi:hypothetical protein
MTTVPKIADHTELALGLLLSQFDGSPRLRRLVSATTDEVQRLEDWIWDIGQLLLLDNAAGWWLDLMGRWASFQRLDAESDDEYRDLLDAAIEANNSKGLAETIISIASKVIKQTIEYTDAGVAFFQLQFTADEGLGAVQYARLADLITRAKRAGTGWVLIEGTDQRTAKRFETSRFEDSRFVRIVAGSELA